MIKMLLKITVIVLAGCILFVKYVEYLEKKTLFNPSSTFIATPEEMDPHFEDVYFKTEDGLTLHGWFIKPAWFINELGLKPKITLLFLHGNSGNISNQISKIKYLTDAGANIFLFDYRGYGKSKGVPSEEGLYKDASAAFDYLLSRPDVDRDWIILYGSFLGGSVAIDLATRVNVAALIIESAFASARDMVNFVYPFVPSFLIRAKFDSLSKIKTVTVPKLFMYSPQDDRVPFHFGKRLFETAPEPKEFFELKGKNNEEDVVEYIKFQKTFKRFIEDRERRWQPGLR